MLDFGLGGSPQAREAVAWLEAEHDATRVEDRREAITAPKQAIRS